MNEFIELEEYTYTLYHPLCQLDKDLIKESKHERIIKRKTIKLLTYNIFLRPPPVNNNQSDWKNERLEEFCKVIYDYDIICLQEMFGALNNRKHSLIRMANKCGFFFYIDTSLPSFMSKYMVDGGLLILSRFPIVSHSFMPYQSGVIADSLSQKGVLYAKIEIKNNCFLNLFSTHLQASYLFSGEYHFNISMVTRMDQMRQLNYFINEVIKSEYDEKKDKIILVGDFNVDALHYKYKRPVNILKIYI
jgi:endonuclease/exonuclease/phosphatase family metal-dependent hydrolase